MMPTRERKRSLLHFERELEDLLRRVEEIESFLRRTNEIVEQGLLGDLVLETTVLTPMPPVFTPEELGEMIRTVLREELGRIASH